MRKLRSMQKLSVVTGYGKKDTFDSRLRQISGSFWWLFWWLFVPEFCTVYVPAELHNNFKSVTAAQGQNMTDVLLEFIQNYVDKYESAPKQKKSRRV
jgi:hypothetical protein